MRWLMGWLKRLPTLQDFNQYTDGLRKTKPVAGVIASKTQRWRTFLFLSFPGNLWVSTISFLGQKEFFRASDCRARRSVQGSTAKKWLPPSAGGSQPDVLPARTWLSLVGLQQSPSPFHGNCQHISSFSLQKQPQTLPAARQSFLLRNA